MSCRTSFWIISPSDRPLGYSCLFFVLSFLTIPFLIGVILFPFFGLYFLYQVIHRYNHWIQVTPTKIQIHYLLRTVTIPKNEFLRVSFKYVGLGNLSVITLHTVFRKYKFGLVDNPKHAADIFRQFKNEILVSKPERGYDESFELRQESASPVTSVPQEIPEVFTPSTKPKIRSVQAEEKSGPVYLTKSERIGSELEMSVFVSLKSSDKIPGYHRELWDFYVPKYGGGYSQIDVLMIHETGIYVIECKNRKGWIFGSEHNLYWYQTLLSGYGQVRKEPFYNPILQNNSHINAVANYLGIEKEYFYSGIVFGCEAVLKAVPEDSLYCFIEKYQWFEGKLMDRICSSPVCLSHDDIDRVYAVLLPCTNVPDEVKKKHKQDIRERYG